MRFMIMTFSTEHDVKAKPPEWAERVASSMAKLDDELATSGELVYSEVLEFGEHGSLIDRHGGRHVGSLAGNHTPLARFWVVRCDEARAEEIAAGIAQTVESAVEVRRVLEGFQRP
ncbi:hypothetical protein C2138_10190 [Salinibacterium hongtaonis]|nr:hypothetical protein C2138_10190 [Salinibacterium hongtaonis]